MAYIKFKATIKKVNLKPKNVKEIENSLVSFF